MEVASDKILDPPNTAAGNLLKYTPPLHFFLRRLRDFHRHKDLDELKDTTCSLKTKCASGATNQNKTS